MIDSATKTGNSPVKEPDSSGGRRYSTLDRLICRFDHAVKHQHGQPRGECRASPSATLEEPELNETERRHSAALMRVNHTGEVCAQALYAGQALVAREPVIKRSLLEAAAEELDHLDWCSQRLEELKSRPSWLNPLWYAGSFSIGLTAALKSDAVSLGFVEETERQVCEHLDGHLAQMSMRDSRSRAIIAAMRADEANHAERARELGAQPLGPLEKLAMKAHARVMTRLAYWI